MARPARSRPTWCADRRRHPFVDETPRPDVAVPGGMTTMEHARDGKLLRWLTDAHPTATWTAPVCSDRSSSPPPACWKNKRATSHWAALTALKHSGVTAVGDERARVHEGDIVTSAGFGGHRPRAVARRRDCR